jgi:aspartyl-tRNA synthetase
MWWKNERRASLPRTILSTREVILFPMNQKAEDLMMNAPAAVMPKQLRELHIRVVDES